MPIRFCWLAVVIGCSLLGLPWPTTAQTKPLDSKLGISIRIGGIKADRASGTEFSLGTMLRVGPIFAEVNPLDATMFGEGSGAFHSSTDTYRGETYDTCINSQNGEEVGTSNCTGTISGRNAPTVNFGAVIPKTPTFFGVGHRFDDEFSTTYWSTGIMAKTSGHAVITLRTNVGPPYFSMAFGTSVLW